MDWQTAISSRPDVNDQIVSNRHVPSIQVDGETEMIVEIGQRTICICNNADMLTTILELAKTKESGQKETSSIETDPDFKAAFASLSGTPVVWGIRLCDRGDAAIDPTSIRNLKSVLGFSDVKAKWIVLQLAASQSSEVGLAYATEDRAAANNFSSTFGGENSTSEHTVRSIGGGSLYRVISVKYKMTSSKEDAAVDFNALTTFFGQGMLL